MAMRWFLLLASSFQRVHSASCYSPADFSTESWPFCQVLTDSLSMYFGPAGDGHYMKLGLHAENHVGWSALAIGGNGGMKGAQQVVVRQVDGAWVAEERYSADYVEPHLQETQEVLLIFANESAGSTSWGVLLPTRSCKAGDRYAMEDVGMFMHWALGYSHAFSYHKERGQFHTNLVSGPPAPPPDMSSFPSVTFTMPDVPVVLGEGGSDAMNPYICGIFDLAEALPAGLLTTSKHHAAKFAPVLSSASKEFVHHMILFECADQVAVDNNFTHNHVIPNCERMVRGCQTSKWPWAVGGEDLVLPDNVGVPIGNGARWYALQVHYYNPSLVPNVSDSSGVHVALAPSLRTHDAETFGVVGGASPMQRDPLPPGQAEVSIPSAVVPTQCTNQWNADEITVLGVMHHAHLVGKKLAIHVSRNGEYIGEMRREKVYDFNHQSLEGSSIKTLKKGDELTLTCSYDTSSRTEPTAFGDFTQDEMCLAYFLHYPAQNARRSIFLRALGENRISLCSDPSQSADSFQLVQNPTQLLASAVQSTAPVLTPPACEPRGDLTSSSARDVLASMGVDVSAFSMDTSSSASGWIRAVAFVAVSLASWGVL